MALSLLFFAFAAFVHESAVVFPVLIAAYVFLFETGEESAGASSSEERSVSAGARLVTALRSSAPFFAVSALYLAARALALGAGATFGLSHTKTTVGVDLVKRKIVPHRVPSNPPAMSLLTTLPAVLCEYLAVLLLPWLAGPAHPVDFVMTAGLANFYLPLGALALAAVAGFLAFRKSPRRRLYLFCTCWWLVTLAPALSLNQVVSLVQDRYQYVPSFAVCLLVADLATRFQISIFSRRAIAAAATAVTLLYVAIVWRSEPIWHDDVAMFGRCVEMFPNSAHYRQALADTLKERGDLQGATRQLAEAVRLEPNSPVTHYALGQLYERMGRTADAEKEFHAYMALFAPWALPRDGASSETGVGPD
jgi:tetratricopeptide (TPR) repeat protein